MTVMRRWGLQTMVFSFADGVDTAISGGNLATGLPVTMIPGYVSPSDRDPHMVLDEFLRRFDRFTDLLCMAAREGATTERASAYVAQRAWFLRHYSIVVPFLRNSGMASLGCKSASDAPPARDEMEALFLPPHIEFVIHCDRVIGRLTSARLTIEACRQMFPNPA